MFGKKLLIDTNILSSVLLRQNNFEVSRQFLKTAETLGIEVLITDFSIYSTCILLQSRGKNILFEQFIKYLGNSPNVKIYRFIPSEIQQIYYGPQQLDFDDKVHYFLGKKENIIFVSYDHDFDKTDLKRLTPAQLLEEFENFSKYQ